MSLCHTEAYALDVPKTYVPKNKSIYHKEWIDFNKNGKKDIYEDPYEGIYVTKEEQQKRQKFNRAKIKQETRQQIDEALYDDFEIDF